MRKYCLVVFVTLLAGCGGNQWTRANTTEAEFNVDSRECVYEGRKYGQHGGGDILWEAYMTRKLSADCMVSRGYTVVPRGAE